MGAGPDRDAADAAPATGASTRRTTEPPAGSNGSEQSTSPTDRPTRGEPVAGRTSTRPHCNSPAGFASRVRSVTYQNQQECLYMRNGSRYMISTPSGRGGRSLSADLVLLDEAFSFEDMRALGAIQPTLATRPMGQFLVFSSAGTGASVLLQHFRDLGHAAVEGDLDAGELDELGGGLGWFEWTPNPTAAYDDPATWLAACPSLGLPGGPTPEPRQRRGDPRHRDIFRREPSNITGRDPYIPLVRPSPGATCRSDDPIVGEPTLAISVNADRDKATLAAAGPRSVGDTDRPRGRCHRHPPRRGSRDRRPCAGRSPNGSRPAVIHDRAPAGARASLLARRGVNVLTLNTSEVVKAVGDMFDAIAAGNIAHRNDPRLNDALAGAIRRKVGEAWTWAPSSSAVDITPLDAVTLARWGAVSTLTPAVW